MRKIFIFLLIILFGMSICFASDDVFNHPSTSKAISSQMPKLKDVSCKFTQEKYIGSAVLKSGGNFQFVKNKGAIFETLYPIKSTVSYTSAQNKQMNDVIVAVSNRNYSYLDRNFLLFYKKENNNWTIGLKPKKGSVTASQLHDIVIKGSVDINNIKIDTIKNGITDIHFKCRTN